MTALIYKAALPTYTSAEALIADAGETLLLNDAGTAYELEPAQGSAYVAGTDYFVSSSPDYAVTQTVVNNAAPVSTITPLSVWWNNGDSFVAGTKGVQIVQGRAFSGSIVADVASGPSAEIDLQFILYSGPVDGDIAQATHTYAWIPIRIGAGHAPSIVLPFTLVAKEPGGQPHNAFPLGEWLFVAVQAKGGNINLDDLGGFTLFRTA